MLTISSASVFVIGQNDTTAYLTGIFGANSPLIPILLAAYPISPLLPTPYDQIAQIFTEFIFQCSQARWANDTAVSGIPAWRYYYNATFPNVQPVPGLDLGVYHSSEIGTVFSTYSKVGVTVQQYALSETMRGMWARFAKNPQNGPGWNKVGTGALSGLYTGVDQVVVHGLNDLAVLGTTRDGVLSSGATIIDWSEVDYRCKAFDPVYFAVNGV